MANSPRIVVAAKPRKPIPVELVGTDYVITPPKSTIAIAIAERAKGADNDPAALMAELNNWITIAFGKTQAKKVIARLNDANDDLDVTDVMELMQKVAEAVTPNPSS